MNSVVLWYDIGRQGATNESMALSPILKDLSGNGNDATCYNFGWSGMSGIGGYNYNVNKAYKYNSKFTIINSTTIHFNKVTINSSNYILYFWPFKTGSMTGTYTIPSLKVKIDNPNNANLKFGLNNPINETVSFNDSRVIEIPEKTIEVNNRPITIGLFYLDDATDGVDVDITLTILPEYPNALVSDGVDDYAVVTGLPLLTPETGYTIIARRARISEVAGSAFAGLPTAANTPAIQIEREYGNSIYVAFNFGQPATITPDWSDVVIWQTSAAYCGVSLLKANAFPSDSLYLFKGSKALPRGAFSLYSLILFNRDLTDEEIEWVKSNLIQ